MPIRDLKFNKKAPVSPGAKILANRAKNTSTGNETFPSDLPEEYRMILISKEFTYGRVDGKTAQIKNVYNLPIPEGVVDNTQLQYQDATLGIKGAAGAAAGDFLNKVSGATSVTQAGAMTADFIKSSMNQVANASKADMTQGLILGAQALGQESGKLGASVGGMIGAYAGQIPNPNITAFFKGVGLKTYTFNWKLYPASLQESHTIQTMLYKMRSDAMPARLLKGLGLSYPYEFHLKILTKGMENVTLFKPAFCTSVNINYAPGGNAFGEDGNPIGYGLSLSFKEIDTWDKTDYDGVEVSPLEPQPPTQEQQVRADVGRAML